MKRKELMTLAQKAILENAHDPASFEYKYWGLWPRGLESNLGKIISLAERKGGIVKARVS